MKVNLTLSGMVIISKYNETKDDLAYLADKISLHEEQVEVFKEGYRVAEQKLNNLKKSAPQLFELLEKRYEIEQGEEQ